MKISFFFFISVLDARERWHLHLPDGPSEQENGQVKGKCHEIFCFWFFLESVSPKPLIIPLGPIREKFATGVVDTGGAPWLANISANFRKNSKRSKWNTLGLGGNWFMKKTRSKKSRHTVPLSDQEALKGAQSQAAFNFEKTTLDTREVATTSARNDPRIEQVTQLEYRHSFCYLYLYCSWESRRI